MEKSTGHGSVLQAVVSVEDPGHVAPSLGGGNYLKDVWSYHTELQEWKKEEMYEKGISHHTLVYTGVQGEVLMVGGRYMYHNYNNDVVMFTTN